MLVGIRKITFEITNRCGLRCRICHIWRQREKVDLKVQDMARVLEYFPHPLSISVTGGEPFLHPRFQQVYAYLLRLVSQKRVNSIDIATSGVSEGIADFLKKFGHVPQPLSFSISLDGMKSRHNRQRGHAWAFDRTLKNILSLRKYGLPVALKFVITRLNYGDMQKVYAFSQKAGCRFHLKFYEHLPSYYHRQGDPEDLAFSPAQRRKIQTAIESIASEELSGKRDKFLLFSLARLVEFLNKGSLSWIDRCLTPSTSLFVTCHKEIFSCLNQRRIGHIRTWPRIDKGCFHRISEKAKQGECPRCLSYHGYLKECNMR